MSKKISYKSIIKNRINNKLNRVIYDRSGHFPTFDDRDICMDGATDLGHPMFSANVKVEWNDYEIHGYVDDFGNAVITSVSYDRMICTEKDADGWWIDESAKPVHKFIYGEELEKFDFAS